MFSNQRNDLQMKLMMRIRQRRRSQRRRSISYSITAKFATSVFVILA